MNINEEMKDLSPESIRSFATACYAASGPTPSHKATAQFLDLLKMADEKAYTPTYTPVARDCKPYRIEPIKLVRSELVGFIEKNHLDLPEDGEYGPLYMAKTFVDAITEEFDIIKKEKK